MATLPSLHNEVTPPSLALLRLLRLSFRIQVLIIQHPPSSRQLPSYTDIWALGGPLLSLPPTARLPILPAPSLIPTTLPFFFAAFTTPLTAHSSLVRAESFKRFLTSAIEVFDKTIYVSRPCLMRAEERTVELFCAYEGPFMCDICESVNVDSDTGVRDKDRILWIGSHRLKDRVRGEEGI
ncbi:hypothetical protein BGX38DRAFT_1331348 [Terfezia claveryi]|nr:hypothetical protein BGX38DRAFT_1331348 [Terfezia claveryi]